MAKRILETVLRGAGGLALAWVIPITVRAQQSAAVSLVFDGATIVDVEQGKLILDQRIVITGNRIKAVGSTGVIKIPKGAQVVDARGKYLIPGLWDMHIHTMRLAHILYPLFLANGVTGFRDTGAEVPLDSLLLWRQEVVAGTRLGPPRQIFSGPYIDGTCAPLSVCLRDSTRTPYLVDSIKAAGADMIKLRSVSRTMYFEAAAEARRVGIPFGGHTEQVTAIEASDSGALLIDHLEPLGVQNICPGSPANAESCRSMVTTLRHNGSWMVIDAFWGDRFGFRDRMREFWSGSLLHGNWLGSTSNAGGNHPVNKILQQIIQLGIELPFVAGTDASIFGPWRDVPLGFMVHGLLAQYVADGLTPLAALQAATLNPAKALHSTDSLGTVAPGKLADLVLLDANPLTDITNTTTIRAVVANGQYFDRAGLDSLLVEIQAKAKEES